MSDEEKKAIETLKEWKDYNIKNKNKLLKANEIINVQETILNLISKQERQLYERNNRIKNLEKECQRYFDNMMDTIREMYDKDRSIEVILNRLENDIKRITDKKAEGYTDDYRRCRLKAYRTKTREIKELIEKQYCFGDNYERGE